MHPVVGLTAGAVERGGGAMGALASYPGLILWHLCPCCEHSSLVLPHCTNTVLCYVSRLHLKHSLPNCGNYLTALYYICSQTLLTNIHHWCYIPSVYTHTICTVPRLGLKHSETFRSTFLVLQRALVVASFPGPAQLSVACSTVKYCKRRKAGWGLGTRLH